jgi:YVTN family beta-propeller protein
MSRSTPFTPRRGLPGLLVLVLAATPAAAAFVTFESGQVRPLALSPDGTRLFAVNTPDNRLEIFAVGAPVAGTSNLTHFGSVPVGLEPVAVAARTDTEVWVVNHLSDSVSVVDLAGTPRVVRTLHVGDEPRDIVFAGPGGNRAFVTTAHRGQNGIGDPQLTTPGVGRADVWVFDALALGPASMGGTPLGVVTLFGDTPRALAVAPGGGTVYAAVFHSGNRTTTVTEGAVCNDSVVNGLVSGPCTVAGVSMPGGLPLPETNVELIRRPETGLIVKFNPAPGVNQWQDQLGRNWNNAVKFTLPDWDVFAIDASTLAQTAAHRSVGTVIFNMAVNPATGRVYVSNTEARNEIRFEGPGVFGGSTVRGRLAEARITVIDGAAVTPIHLNKHIPYGTVPSPAGVKDDSLATPLGMAVNAAGDTLWVAAFGSSKIGVFNTSALEANLFTPSAASHIGVSGGGPSGLVLDEARSRLYVLTRFDNAVSVIDTVGQLEIAHLPLHNPEPASVVDGRPFLYDAVTTSSNGEASCAACHIFGDFDSLAWDLGNPDDIVVPNPNPVRVADLLGISFVGFHPMKGPMTTQSLRGMANHGPMHWRGDRTGGSIGGDPLSEDLAFKAFNVAFDGLLGRGAPLTNAQMQAFTDFILQVTYPPNPIRALDNALTPDQQAGRDFYFSAQASDVFENCNGCHRLDPAAGFFGSDGFTSFENEPQLLKIPHLRNMYQKVGMFGMPAVPFINAGDNGHKGDQVRGFGFLHDGSVDTLLRFHNATVFNQVNAGGFPISNPGGFPNGAPGDPQRRQVEEFMLAFDSNLAPAVGQQVTITPGNGAAAGSRIALLLARAAAGECDVVVKGVLAGEARGWVRLPAGTFQSDRGSESPIAEATLRAQAGVGGQERTYGCVPPGSGTRIGIDRDEDGHYDRTELDVGSDPADPASVPGASTTTSTALSTSTTTSSSTTSSTVPFNILVPTRTLLLRDDSVPPVNDARRRVVFRAATRGQPTVNRVVPPAPGSAADPTLNGGRVVVYNSAGQTPDVADLALGQANWQRLGSVAAPRGWLYRNAGGPITKVVLRRDVIVVKGRGPLFPYTLDEPAQGRVAVSLELGLAASWCADAPAKTSGTPPSTAANDTVDRFLAQPNSPAPVACPPLPEP